MIELMKQYDIRPIFIFDGKPPPDKIEQLEKRRRKKWEAEDQYNELVKQNSTDEKQLQELKNKSIKISETHCQTVKRILDEHNITYYHSTQESDPLCVFFVNANRAWACLSEDMDMFAYGCKRVIQNIDLQNHTFRLYSLQHILSELRIEMNDFKHILILSGTDYNDSSGNLYKLMALYKDYKEYREPDSWRTKTSVVVKTSFSFYNWLEEFHPNYTNDKTKFRQCYELFDLNHYKELLAPYYALPAKFHKLLTTRLW
jgi:hypothetical protein